MANKQMNTGNSCKKLFIFFLEIFCQLAQNHKTFYGKMCHLGAFTLSLDTNWWITGFDLSYTPKNIAPPSDIHTVLGMMPANNLKHNNQSYKGKYLSYTVHTTFNDICVD